jgi:hypothetical protein
MEYFEELGRRVEERWRAAGFDDRVFAALAAEELERSPAHRVTTTDDIIDWCNRPGVDLPLQHDLEARFGDPPLTVYRGHEMFIVVNFWTTSTPTGHEHAFDGAFQVLSGSSLHTQLHFTERERYNAHASAGELHADPPERLLPGATRAIVAGPAFIHSLSHLEHPSSTVVVRTAGNRQMGLQRNFYWPGLALDPLHQDPTAKRMSQVAGLMCATARPGLDAWLRRALASLGPREAFEMLLAVTHAWAARPEVDHEALEALAAPYVELVERSSRWGALAADAFRHHRRIATLTRARSRVTATHHRLLLALLMHARTSSDVYRLVSESFPYDDPIAKVFGWVAELCGPASPIGVVLDSSIYPVARLLAEGKPLDAIAAELNESGRTARSVGDVASARLALQRSLFGKLLP